MKNLIIRFSLKKKSSKKNYSILISTTAKTEDKKEARTLPSISTHNKKWKAAQIKTQLLKEVTYEVRRLIIFMYTEIWCGGYKYSATSSMKDWEY